MGNLHVLEERSQIISGTERESVSRKMNVLSAGSGSLSASSGWKIEFLPPKNYRSLVLELVDLHIYSRLYTAVVPLFSPL